MVHMLKNKEEVSKILEEIYKLFPNASCESLFLSRNSLRTFENSFMLSHPCTYIIT